jgi:hypothetical protein
MLQSHREELEGEDIRLLKNSGHAEFRRAQADETSEFQVKPNASGTSRTSTLKGRKALDTKQAARREGQSHQQICIMCGAD